MRLILRNKLMTVAILTLTIFTALSLAMAANSMAIDRFQAAAKFDALSHDSCGNGTSWVCFSREESVCTWLSTNYFSCFRYWVEVQYGVHIQEQKGSGHLQPYPYVAGAWYSPDYHVQNIG